MESFLSRTYFPARSGGSAFLWVQCSDLRFLEAVLSKDVLVCAIQRISAPFLSVSPGPGCLCLLRSTIIVGERVLRSIDNGLSSTLHARRSTLHATKSITHIYSPEIRSFRGKRVSPVTALFDLLGRPTGSSSIKEHSRVRDPEDQRSFPIRLSRSRMFVSLAEYYYCGGEGATINR